MKADLIVANVSAFTLDPEKPHAEAVAVVGDRIAFVGSEAEALQLRGPDTEVVDGGGKTLLPGIVDAHFHLMWGSLRLNDILLTGVRGLEGLRTAVATYRAANPDATWLRGSGLSYDVLPGSERLTRQHLDAIEPNLPLVLTCFDFHTVWCNTVALNAAGILHGANPGGNAEVVLGDDGAATGELREFEAMHLVYDLIPEVGAAQKLRLLEQGVKLAHSYGITSVHNMNGDAEEFALYRQLDERGELGLRVYFPYRLSPHESVEQGVAEAVSLRDGYRSDFLRAGALKLFMDGVVESFTAFLTEPYADLTTSGEAIFSAQHFDDVAVCADAAGLQIAVHAVGDAAVRRALDGYALAQRENGVRDSRHRVEHVELLHPDDTGRFHDLGVVASMQPYHCTRPELGYLPSWLRFVPEARFRDSFPWRSLRAAGAHLAFGSDWPVVSMNPFLGFDAAVNRQPWADTLPSEAQTVMQTLAAYTRDAAYTEFMEHEKGTLKTGLLADMVLLSEDVLELPPADLAKLSAELTVCGGKIVHEA